jgi:hypothetical protein
VAYLDLEYAKIKEISQVIGDVKYYGLRIIKNKNYEDILSEDQALINKWFEYLKRYCILSQFGMAYENVKVLGQGNFAKVFLGQAQVRRSPVRSQSVRQKGDLQR